MSVAIRCLGSRDYASVYQLQFELQRRRQQGEIPDTVLLLEHPKVITQGRRPALDDLHLSAKELAERGYEFFQVNRGGLLTYHGPGQLIAYFIFSLSERGLTVSEFVHSLEGLILKTLEKLGLAAERQPSARGLWVGARKIASVGIGVSRGVSMHGLALNVATELEDFSVITPCGLDGVAMTSVEAELGRQVALEEVETLLRDEILKTFPPFDSPS